MTEVAPGQGLPAPTGSVKEELLAFLAFLRAVLVRKVEGLSEDQARRPLVESGTSLLGILNHLAVVERYWVHHRVGGLEAALDEDVGFALGPDDSVATVVARYREVAARSEGLLAGRGLDEPLGRSRQRRTVGWVLLHLLQETARHAGHADILRELLDGAVGM